MSNTLPDEVLIHELNLALLHLYKAEEEFWKQLSRQLWLALGDSNTGYLYAVSKTRSEKIDSQWSHTKMVYLWLKRKTSQRWSQHITLTSSNLWGFNGQQTIAEALQPCISESQNERLIRLPQWQEIKESTFAINADKAPGPDEASQPVSFSPTGRSSGKRW